MKNYFQWEFFFELLERRDLYNGIVTIRVPRNRSKFDWSRENQDFNDAKPGGIWPISR